MSHILYSVPRILHIGILRDIIAFHLHIGRYAYAVPTLYTIVFFVKVFDCKA